jgi:predicted enzyme related to lactoylglutathione lyase
MGERTAYTPGTFCWADLIVPDTVVAKEFYSALFGWTPRDVPGYTFFVLDGKDVAGLAAGPDGYPPIWLSYVAVDDADRSAARAAELGGEVTMAPRDTGVPAANPGRGALLADPQGAAVGLWQAGQHIGAGLVNDPGAMSWNHLVTSDVDGATTFYTGLFGWTTDVMEESDPPFTVWRNSDGWLNGAVTELPADAPAPHWLVYFTIADLDGALERAAELGGRVLVPETSISIARFAVVGDPQGATFTLYEGKIDP